MKTLFLSESEPIKYFDKKISRKRCIKTYLYQCFCGKQFISRKSPRETNSSCGCLRKNIGNRTTKHGYTRQNKRHKLYGTWRSMIARCYCKSDVNYKHYGGRGIIVCDSWKASFENFLKDMGEKPMKHLSIDRIDVNGNYEPSNCRWATQLQQNNNRRDTIIIEYKKQRKPLSDWIKITGLKKNTLIYRIKKGWNPIDIIEKPARKMTYV